MSLELGRLLRRLKNITELLVVQDTFLPDLQYLSGLAQIGTAGTRKWVGSNYHSFGTKNSSSDALLQYDQKPLDWNV